MNSLIKKREVSRGLVKTVIMIVVALLILSYFGLNIRTIVNSPAGQENFSYAQELMVKVWDGFLKKPVMYLWKDIFLDLIWNPAVENLTKIKNGEPDDLRTNAPEIPAPQQVPS